jgi:hypothetical protein
MGLTLSGTGQFLSRPTSIIAVSPLTIAAWVKPSALTGDPAVMSMTMSGNSNLFMLDLNSGVPRASVKFGGTFAAATASSGAVSTVAWTHVCAVFTPTSRTIYVNGISKGSNSTAGTPSGINLSFIGALSGGNLYAGDLAYPSVWSIALSAPDVAALYNAGAGTDPNTVQTSSLISYTSLPAGGGPYVDSVSSVVWTLTGSPVFVTDPFSQAPVSGLAVDATQLNIPMYNYSYYMQPWKGYMDTWPGSKLIDCLGINFNVGSTYFDATAQMLSEAGFSHGRFEVGWGSMSYADDNFLTSASLATNTAILNAFKK